MLRKRIKELAINVSISSLTVVFLLGFLEFALRQMPVKDVIRNKKLDVTANAFDVSAPANQNHIFSKNFNFELVNTRATNSLGFFSDFDYSANLEGIFVIGDSMVEALQVPFENTFHQQLSRELNSPIANIALSGAPLSQYEAYAREVCERYKPEKLIIVVVENDYLQSFYDHRIRDGFFHYRGEELDLRATEYHLSPLRELANASSLVRYVYFNLNVGSKIRPILSDMGDSARHSYLTQNLGADTILELRDIQERVSDHFLTNMQTLCVKNRNIYFVVDAERNDDGIYGGNIERAEIGEYFIERARNSGFKVIDLNPSMYQEYQQNKQRFEFLSDRHWNTLGHTHVKEQLKVALKDSHHLSDFRQNQ